MEKNIDQIIATAIANKSTFIDLSNCDLFKLHDKLDNLKYITSIDLSCNELTDIKVLCKLTKLQHIDLSNNKLEKLPDEIGNLKNLKSIDITGNPITILPESFANLQNLEELDAYQCNFVNFPKEIFKLNALKNINFGNNLFDNLHFFDNELAFFQKLQKCVITSHFCKSVSNNIASFNFNGNHLIGRIYGAEQKRPFGTPLEMKGIFTHWRTNLLTFLGLENLPVRVTVDYRNITKGTIGLIGIHDYQLGYDIFDAPTEIPVQIDFANNHTMSCGVPFEILEFVDDEYVDLHNHTKWSDGSNSVHDQVVNAIRHGIKHYGITDHLETLKCPSLEQVMIPDYIANIHEVQKEFEGMIKVYAGVEINLNRLETQLDKLNYDLLNQLDYVLWEHLNYNANCVTFEQLPKYLEPLKIRSGLAHTNIVSIGTRQYSEKGGVDFLLNIMQQHNIFWEINSNEGYVFFKRYIYPDDEQIQENQAFFEKLKQYNIEISVGGDCHTIQYYNFDRLRRANWQVKMYNKM